MILNISKELEQYRTKDKVLHIWDLPQRKLESLLEGIEKAFDEAERIYPEVLNAMDKIGHGKNLSPLEEEFVRLWHAHYVIRGCLGERAVEGLHRAGIDCEIEYRANYPLNWVLEVKIGERALLGFAFDNCDASMFKEICEDELDKTKKITDIARQVGTKYGVALHVLQMSEMDCPAIVTNVETKGMEEDEKMRAVETSCRAMCEALHTIGKLQGACRQ